MNFRKAFMFFSAATLLFASCSNEDSTPGVEPEKDAPASVSLNNASASTATYSFTANAEWAATSTENWVTISPASGKGGGKTQITLTTTSANDLLQNRKATIKITSGGESISFDVVQAAKVPSITFDPTTLVIPATLTATVSVTSNVEFEVKSKPDWIGAITLPTTTKGTIQLTITAPESFNAKRTGTIILKDKNSDYEAPLAVENEAIPDVTGTMNDADFAANEWYLMKTKQDITITNAKDGEFVLTALTLNGTTPTETVATWLSFAKNPDFTSKLVYTATVEDYTSKTVSRSARIYVSPKNMTPAQLIAAGDRFKVKDAKQFPDAVQFSGFPGSDLAVTYRGVDIIYGYGPGVSAPNIGTPSEIPTATNNGFPFVLTDGKSFASSIFIEDKNTNDQSVTIFDAGVSSQGVMINTGADNRQLPNIVTALKFGSYGTAESISYIGVAVTVEGTTVTGLFKVKLFNTPDQDHNTQDYY